MKKRAPAKLREIPAREVTVFKIRNRKGYAAVCLDNLTEGRTAAQAVDRLTNPLRRMGLALKGRVRGL